MECIFCGGETHVTDKRHAPSGTRRRRECLKCKKRFTTYEKPEATIIYVIKKDGRREVLDAEKIKLGMVKACEKRPISMNKIDNIVNEIIEKLIKKGREVRSKEIGEMVMKKLKRLDKVAYIRFASVYKDFKDVSDFKKEIKEVKE